MDNKKMKKDLIVVTSVLVTTIATVLIGYFAITNTLQLWQTFLQYIAEGQNVTMGLLVVAIWQNVGLQLVTPALAVYGCFVLANFILGQADLSRIRVKSFQFGVFTLMLGSLMLIFPTPQNVSLTVMLFVIPGLLATFLSMERPNTSSSLAAGQRAVQKNSRVATKKHYRRYLRK